MTIQIRGDEGPASALDGWGVVVQVDAANQVTVSVAGLDRVVAVGLLREAADALEATPLRRATATYEREGAEDRGELSADEYHAMMEGPRALAADIIQDMATTPSVPLWNDADPYTTGARLCDDDGIVRKGAMHHGTDYTCTGHAHYAGEHIRCESPGHPGNLPAALLDALEQTGLPPRP